MPLEKGGKYMETYNAEVTENDSEYYLSFDVNGEKYKMPLTKDEPNDVKEVFNQLIIHLKNGPFNFTMLEKEDGDIIYHVAKEYLGQLNSELDDIYNELEEYDLIDENQIEEPSLV